MADRVHPPPRQPINGRPLMGGAMSRRKGAKAENEVVKWLQTNGHPHAERRGAGFEAADIIGIPGVTIEVKNQAKMELAGWVDQLVDEMDADDNRIGVVVHKRRGRTDVGGWYATLPVHVFVRLLAEAGYGDEVTP